MVELLEAVASWRTAILVPAVFGFAPGACLRLIVRAYPRDDPRRAELKAELYVLPWWERPLWVAEQLEVAVFDGVPHRLRSRRGKGALRARPDEPPAQDLERFVGLF